MDLEFLYKIHEKKKEIIKLAKIKGESDKEVLEKNRKLEKMILNYLKQNKRNQKL